MNLDDPTAVALAAADALAGAGVEHALYGGLVLAAYGAARETRDADFAVVGASAAAAAAAIGVHGVAAAVAFERKAFGGLWISRITLIGGLDPTGLNTVDLVEPRSRAYARRALERALQSRLRQRELRLLAPEDFILFKLLSTRPQDLADAASVLAGIGSDLDRALVESEVEEIGRDLPDWPILRRWQEVLALPR